MGKGQKNCALCCIDKSNNKNTLCSECLKIRRYILHKGRDAIINYISQERETSVIIQAGSNPSAPPYGRNGSF